MYTDYYYFVIQSVTSSPIPMVQPLACFLFGCSYDDTLAFWDTRSFKRPMETVALSGGVWRIRQKTKNNGDDHHLLAVAAMYDGFHLVDVDRRESVLNFREHESIAYGIDFCHAAKSSAGDRLTLVSCSFYDHLVKVWTA